MNRKIALSELRAVFEEHEQRLRDADNRPMTKAEVMDRVKRIRADCMAIMGTSLNMRLDGKRYRERFQRRTPEPPPNISFPFSGGYPTNPGGDAAE